MSDTVTLDDLRRILTSCAGGDEAALSGDILDSTFEDLGYDSLALMETMAAVAREYGAVVPDDELQTMETPREMLKRVNGLLVAG